MKDLNGNLTKNEVQHDELYDINNEIYKEAKNGPDAINHIRKSYLVGGSSD